MAVDIDYDVSYRKVKYPRLEFRTGKLLLVLPYGREHLKVLRKHKNWIEVKSKFINECLQDSRRKELSDRTQSTFKHIIDRLVAHTSSEIGKSVNKIFIRKMKTKWASLSLNNNLTINTYMQYLPEKLINYIVYHELSHLIERKHNNKFWEIISTKYGETDYYEKALFSYWFLIQNTIVSA